MILKLKMMIKKEDQYVCKVCSKAFSRGKALVGHMRAHKPEKHGRRPHRRSSNGGYHVDDTTCKLCGRVFRSMKSLFGHMKCHPERDWRGMNPPSATTQHGLHICGKQIEVEEVDDLVSAAVEGLLMLVGGGDDDNEEKDKYVDDDSIGYELSDMFAREDGLEKKMISCSDKKKAVREKRKLETLEAVNDNELSGSLSGHKKYKSNRRDEEEGGEEEKVHVKSEKEEVDKPEKAMILGLHRCEVCYKTFSTGQALGGHMTCHRVVPSSMLGLTSGSAEEAASGRRVMDFDLNELPHEVEDGGAVDVASHGA